MEQSRTDRFERLNATRMSVAREGWTERNLNFAIGKMQTNLGGTSRKRKDTLSRVFPFSMKFVPCGTSEILLRNMKYASRMKYAYGI